MKDLFEGTFKANDDDKRKLDAIGALLMRGKTGRYRANLRLL
jgi:hypothetical protein